MCLNVHKDFSKNPIDIAIVNKALTKVPAGEDGYRYVTPYRTAIVPESGVLVPEHPKFHGEAHRPTYASKGVIDGGLIHAYHDLKSKRNAYTDVIYYGTLIEEGLEPVGLNHPIRKTEWYKKSNKYYIDSSVYNEIYHYVAFKVTTKLHKAIAFGVEYSGLRDVAARTVYIPECDTVHTKEEKEEFMQVCEDLALSEKIGDDYKIYIFNYLHSEAL